MGLISKGTHKAVVSAVGNDACQFGNGKPGKYDFQIAITFEIVEGEDAGRKATKWLYFTPTQWDRNLDTLRYCGFVGDDIATFPAQRPTNVVEIVIVHDSYNGKVSAKVEWVNPLGGGGGYAMRDEDKLPPAALRKAAAMAKARLAKKPAIAGTKREDLPPSSPPADDEVIDPEDIGDPDPTAGMSPLGGDDDISF